MKQRKLKNAVSFLLACLLLLGMIPAVSAAEGEKQTATPVTADTKVPSAPSVVSNKTIEEVQTVLSDYSYTEYLETLPDTDAGKDVITLQAADGVYTPDNVAPDAAAEITTFGPEDDQRDNVLLVPETGKVEWRFNVEDAGLYTMYIDYCPADDQKSDIERILYVNGKIPYSEARYLTLFKTWGDDFDYENTERGFSTDDNGNELRPNKEYVEQWSTYRFIDSTGYYTGTLQFYLNEGENTIALESTRESVVIDTITIEAAEQLPTYEEYLKEQRDAGHQEAPADAYARIETELPQATSSATIYPTYDRTSGITSPQDPAQIRYNTIGSASTWAKIGTWIEWEVDIPQDGLYNIYTRFRQSEAVDKFVSRMLYIDGEIPFEEAQSIRFDYEDDWQVQALGDHTDKENDVNYLFYLSEGKHTIRLEIALGDLSQLLEAINSTVDPLNTIYLKILQITGASPDVNRDYNFMELIPDYMDMMLYQAKELDDIVKQFEEINGYVGSEVKTLEEIARLLRRMGSDEYEIAPNFSTFKSNIGTLGTWIYNATEQPLELDFIDFQSPANEEEPQATATTLQSIGYELRQFVASFYSSYSNFSTGYSENSADHVTLWFTGGRDQAQILKRMLDDSFTVQTGIPVEMKFTTDAAIMPAMLAGVGPDVSEMPSTNVINWAIRGAVEPIDFEDTDEVVERFADEATVPFTLYNYSIEDDTTTETLYGIPVTMDFSMMYYRLDILSDLFDSEDMEGQSLVPDTWDELRSLLPVLQANHMDIGAPGYSALYQIFLYQHTTDGVYDGSVYADHGLRIGLDEALNLSCFQDACEIYTQYNFPLTYDFMNRFRTGEMPIGFSPYTSVTQLNVFATEIRGLWEFTTIPGTYEYNEDGEPIYYSNLNVATYTGTAILRGCGDKNKVWEYIKWWTDEPQQTRYGNELESVLGIGTRHNTSNKYSVMNQPWSTEEANKIEIQLDNLKATPEYPGSYIIERYVSFAFNNAYNDDQDPVDEILSYVPYINKEINRKRQEFDMDTLELGTTLADLREEQASGDANEG